MHSLVRNGKVRAHFKSIAQHCFIKSSFCLASCHKGYILIKCYTVSLSWCLGVAAIKNHTPPVFSCVVWLLSGTKRIQLDQCHIVSLLVIGLVIFGCNILLAMRFNYSRLFFESLAYSLVSVKLVLCDHWMYVAQVCSVTSENQFHCTRLYILKK